MSVMASPRAIGLFVLGAIVLGVLGLLAFGGRQAVQSRRRLHHLLRESLKGLRRGAPVTFRGVDVGQVTEIRAIYDSATGDVRVPVTVEIRPGAVLLTDSTSRAGAMQRLVEHGLRARLDVQSMLTGQLLMALDFFVPAATGRGPPPPATGSPSVTSTWAGLQRTVDEALFGSARDRPHAAEELGALRDLLSRRTARASQQTLVALAALRIAGRSRGAGAADPGGAAGPGRQIQQATVAQAPPCWRRSSTSRRRGREAGGDRRSGSGLGRRTRPGWPSSAQGRRPGAALVRENRRAVERVRRGRPARDPGLGRGRHPAGQRAQRDHPRHAPGPGAVLPGRSRQDRECSCDEATMSSRPPPTARAAGGAGRSRRRLRPALPGQGPRAPHASASRPKTPSPTTCPRELVAGRGRADLRATLDTDRIAVVTNGIGVDYVALAYWVDRAPAMVQTLHGAVVPQFGPGRPGGHQPGPAAGPNSCSCSDLRAFQLNRGGSGSDVVRVLLNAQLLRMPRRDSVGGESFASELDAGGHRHRCRGGRLRRGARQGAEGAGRLDRAHRQSRRRLKTYSRLISP